MINTVKTNSYIKTRMIRFLGVGTACLLLGGCFGGTVAQQLVRSIATSIADKTIANAMDVNEDTQQTSRQSVAFSGKQSDELSYALMNTRFKQAPIKKIQINKQPLKEKPIQIIKANAFIRVKVINLIIGEEKRLAYEKAKRLGALNLPDQQAWNDGYVAAGEIKSSGNTTQPKGIIFHIPAPLGKPISGNVIIVEQANLGDLHIARYHLNEDKIYQATNATSVSWQN